MKDETSDPGYDGGLPDRYAIEVTKAIFKRWHELEMELLNKDLEIAAREDSPLDSIIGRARWDKKIDMI